MSSTAFDLSENRAAAVMGLLERASVPPFPAFYRLIFDYLAGVRQSSAGRIGNILTNPDGNAREVLYQEFVEPYENREPIDRAINTMVRRLRALDALMARSAETAADNRQSLAAAGEHFSAGSLDRDLLLGWVRQLEAHAERMRQANAALTEEIADARHELTATRDEIRRSRESNLYDSLTGIANRAGIDEVLQRLTARSQGSFCIVMLDVDHFKRLNDTYGHQVGDRVLLMVTRALRGAIRTADTCGRTGGDEFMMILPDVGIGFAEEMANRVRTQIAASDLEAAAGEALLGGVTVSVGVAEQQRGEGPDALIERADRSLYRAKADGRNRVVALPAEG